MKRLIAIVSFLAISASGWSTNPGHDINHNCINVISMADDVFQFRSDNHLSGATIEVYEFKTEKKVITASIERKSTSVSLEGLEPGDYLIIITKGDFYRKYVFHKNSSSHVVIAANNTLR